MTKEIYFSLDVEADGPIPGVNSMLQVGLAAFTEDGPVLTGTPDGDTPPAVYRANLMELPGSVKDPESMKWWEKNWTAYLATRERPRDPSDVMGKAVAWVKALAEDMGRKPICVGYPASYDFMWWHWYAIKFAGRDPFGFQAIDCKTAAMMILGTSFSESTKRNFPRSWFKSDLVHTHDAGDDALEQGYMFLEILRAGRRLRGEGPK